jgi:CDGSH-type Zn-finger protein
MKNAKRIKVLKNGPYEVLGNIPLNQLNFVPDSHGASIAYKEVKKYDVSGTYHLCRCGKSNNKPFCDGSHLQGFDGQTTAEHIKYEEMAKFIEGNQIDLLDAEDLCAVARFCDTHGQTWNLVDNGTSQEEIDIVIQQCCDCPSGRLTAVTKEGEHIEPKLEQEISILEDPAAHVHAPIWVKGGIPIEDEDGNEYPIRNRVTLCRCGLSENKPFCDAQHMHNKGELKG